MKLAATELLHREDVKILGQLLPGGKNTRQQLAAKTRLPQTIVNVGIVTLLNNGLIREEYGKPCRYVINSTAKDLKRVIEEQQTC